jgi:hypothetical protein
MALVLFGNDLNRKLYGDEVRVLQGRVLEMQHLADKRRKNSRRQGPESDSSPASRHNFKIALKNNDTKGRALEFPQYCIDNDD